MFHLPILFQSGLLSEMKSRRNKSDYSVSRELMAKIYPFADGPTFVGVSHSGLFYVCTCVKVHGFFIGRWSRD